MFVMNYADVTKNAESLFNILEKRGEAFIDRADGKRFKITMQEQKKSPFAHIKPVLPSIPLDEVIDIIHESRSSGAASCSLAREYHENSFAT